MERETIDFIASCEEACFPRPWTSDEVQSCICGEYGVCVIENGIGYAIGRISFDEAELYRIAVLPEKRRAGAGKRLLTGFIDECVRRGAEKIFLEVRAKNVPAVSLYEQFGFTRISVRGGYYGDDDALIYCLNV
ncbi:MAG: ribosomal protein S18-alanine N-acetyltransferase [Ruminiclostridium sp.]|nr:ribosomal protein S18-alanine N-acetyltransferase [Ruminiclostridium sp.]